MVDGEQHWEAALQGSCLSSQNYLVEEGNGDVIGQFEKIHLVPKCGLELGREYSKDREKDQ